MCESDWEKVDIKEIELVFRKEASSSGELPIIRLT